MVPFAAMSNLLRLNAVLEIALLMVTLPQLLQAQAYGRHNSRGEPVAHDPSAEMRLNDIQENLEENYVTKDQLRNALTKRDDMVKDEDDKLRALSDREYQAENELRIVSYIGGAVIFLLGILVTQLVNRLVGRVWPKDVTTHSASGS